jgi:hypothetical protein
MLEEYGRDEGAALAKVALQHLFRVYPELRAPAITLLEERPNLSAGMRRTLSRYGIAGASGNVSGAMMRMALTMVAAEGPAAQANGLVGREEARPLISEWAEELAGLSYRRNVMERSLRSIVINFLRMAALTSKDGHSAKTTLLAAVPQKRRVELEPFTLDAIAEKLFWLELVAVISKNWTLFERIFGDKTAFGENAGIVNDRPDAHAKHLEPSDIAMHRRALQWLDERITRI